MQTVEVRPSGQWWIVRSDGLSAPLMFSSGARAERTARQLAMAWATSGADALLDVRTRPGDGYRFLCQAGSERSGPQFRALPDRFPN
ncbi:MAG TPA: hypothetical protein VGB60_10380 [Brevundimonas sp.]|jgi:hypothetical protein|uniref:hypothetical protein n=1 Tax=Brevundimonas sp. TaxID=1871086 RepID=UPI002ED96893